MVLSWGEGGIAEGNWEPSVGSRQDVGKGESIRRKGLGKVCHAIRQGLR